MKTLILNLVLITAFLVSCKQASTREKQKQINTVSSVKIKEEVIYPLRNPFDNDFYRQYMSYLNRKNGGC